MALTLARFVASGPLAACVLAFTLLPRSAHAQEVELEEESSSATPHESEEDSVASNAPRETEGSSSEDGDRKAASSARDFGHFGQFGLRVGIVGGYRMIFRYDDSPLCRQPDPAKGGYKEQQQFCGHGAPLALDVALSFAPLDSVELFGWGRFGLSGEEQTDTEAVKAFGVGLRLYSMSTSKLKIFVQPAAAMSFEGGGTNPLWQNYLGFQPSYDADLLFQLSVGPQYDFNRYFGLYASAGVTVGVLRAMSASLEGTLGVQGRLP